MLVDKSTLKKLFYIIVVPVLRRISFVFFDRRLLKGRYFDNTIAGWIWVFKGIWFQKILGFNRHLPFPANHTVTISLAENLVLGENTLNNFQSSGTYFQNFSAKITLGDNCYVAPNVGIITANHNPENLNEHLQGENVIIGNSCWIGMNSVILPGVSLGENTIVGAGSVVTKSFLEGNVIIAGNPAKVIRRIELK